jgi:hypothetical protein
VLTASYLAGLDDRELLGIDPPVMPAVRRAAGRVEFGQVKQG